MVDPDVKDELFDTELMDEEAVSDVMAAGAQSRPPTWRLYWRRLRKRPAALVGTVIFCGFLFLAVFGVWVAPYDYQAQDANIRLDSPTLSHPFGTDQFGRDILSRVIVGTRNIFLLGGFGTLLALVIGTAIGLASGYVGGTIDEVVMRLLDVLLSFPSLLLALVLLSTVGPSNINLVLVVAIVYVPMVARVVRSMVLDLKSKEFVEAARVRGERSSYVLFREILAELAAAAAGRGFHALLVLDLPRRLARVPRARRSAPVARLGAADQRGAQLLRHRAVGTAVSGLHDRRAGRLDESHVGRSAPGHAAGRREELMQASAARPVFEVEGLDIQYTTELGALDVVRDVSFAVHEHESFGLVGESGSGKSTLAMGAIRYLASNGRVTDGSARLNGVELFGLSPKELRGLWGSRVGVVYQNPLSALNPSITIGKQLAEVARQHLGMDKSAAGIRVAEMLTKVAMPDPEAVMKRYPHQLSGGMLQRCVIAMALMTNPSLLIMDEPTTALDVTTQAVVLDLVAELKREFDSAILYITHDLGVITKICDRVGVMYAGEFMEQAALEDLFKRPLHPYTLDLLGCVPHFEDTPEKRLLVTIPGSIPRVDDLPPGCIFAPRCSYAEDACSAARPALRRVAGDHSTACRRWAEIPSLETHLRLATEALRGDEVGLDESEVLVEAEQTLVHFKAARGLLSGFGERRPVRAVDGVDLRVDVGRTLGIVGESGSGKTTLARAIIGLTPATGGEILLRGEPLPPSTGARPQSVLKEIQMVFQNPDASLEPYAQRRRGDHEAALAARRDRPAGGQRAVSWSCCRR